MITVEIAGRPAAREDLLDWESRDRLGVVIDSPFGALGAGLLVLLCVTAFYDAEKQKRRLRRSTATGSLTWPYPLDSLTFIIVDIRSRMRRWIA